MKYFRLLGIMSLLVFSFYLTDRVTELAINTNPLMQNIKSNMVNYEVKSVDAIINKNTIIPGIKGKKVNEMESFLNMKDFGSFNDTYLIYDSYSPNISLDDNKDKVIISGNKNIRQVSIIVGDNSKVTEYLDNRKIKYSKLIKVDSMLNYNENINGESSEKSFNDLDTLLNKKKLNKKICVLDYSNIKVCRDKNYYIVNPNMKINNNNYVNIINNIDNGSIIMIDDNFKVDNFKVLVSKLMSYDLKIVYLSEIIKE